MSRGPACLWTPSLHSKQHFVAAEIDVADIGRVDRAVADHARRIVGRPARRRLLVQVPVRVVLREQLRRRPASALTR